VDDEAPQTYEPLTADSPTSAEPSAMDFDVVVQELLRISQKYLGENADLVTRTITSMPRTARGLRESVSSIREIKIPGHPAKEIQEMTRAMLAFAAERITAA
jgi:hypothetical protein